MYAHVCFELRTCAQIQGTSSLLHIVEIRKHFPHFQFLKVICLQLSLKGILCDPLEVSAMDLKVCLKGIYVIPWKCQLWIFSNLKIPKMVETHIVGDMVLCEDMMDMCLFQLLGFLIFFLLIIIIL